MMTGSLSINGFRVPKAEALDDGMETTTILLTGRMMVKK